MHPREDTYMDDMPGGMDADTWDWMTAADADDFECPMGGTWGGDCKSIDATASTAEA